MAAKSATGMRTPPHPGGAKSSALSGAMSRKRPGGWRNAKAAPVPTASGATNVTSPGSTLSNQTEAGGGGRSTARSYAGLGSLAMKGGMVVKHAGSGPKHFQSAQPAGKKSVPTQHA